MRFLSVLLIFIPYVAFAQHDNLFPKNPITKDASGNTIEMHIVAKKMASGNYIAESIRDIDGRITHIQLREATEEEKDFLKSPKNEKNDLVGYSAAPFKTLDISGNTINSNDYAGQILVLNFWYVECPPCIALFEILNEIHEEYIDDERVRFISMAKENKKQVSLLLQKHPIDFPLIADAKNIFNDYLISSFPAIIVIDRQGNIYSTQYGGSYTTSRELKNNIKSALAGLIPQKYGEPNKNYLTPLVSYYLADKTKIGFKKAMSLLKEGYSPSKEVDKDGKEYILIHKPK